MKKRLLLVGKEPQRVDQSSKLNYHLRDKWTVLTANTTQEALALFAQEPCAAVVADPVLSDGSGLRLLDQILEQYPATARFVLGDLSDRRIATKCTGNVHYCLALPADAATLEAALHRAAQLELWLGSPALKKLFTQIRTLPSPPSTYFQILKELRSPAASLESISTVIERDPAVTGKLLQLVNSASFSLARHVVSAADAVLFLGLETTQSMVLLAHCYSHFDHVQNAGFSVEELWKHSFRVAKLARMVTMGHTTQLREESFTAGVLHDLGKLVLASHNPQLYRKAIESLAPGGPDICAAEHEQFGTDHTEVGAWLAAIWGLPNSVVEAIALHHHPTKFLSEGFSPLTAVHVANVLENSRQGPTGLAGAATLADTAYLQGLGLTDRWNDWTDKATEMAA
jgi:putative nucleotidyltransferase with HDIG domain